MDNQSILIWRIYNMEEYFDILMPFISKKAQFVDDDQNMQQYNDVNLNKDDQDTQPYRGTSKDDPNVAIWKNLSGVFTVDLYSDDANWLVLRTANGRPIPAFVSEEIMSIVDSYPAQITIEFVSSGYIDLDTIGSPFGDPPLGSDVRTPVSAFVKLPNGNKKLSSSSTTELFKTFIDYIKNVNVFRQRHQ